MSDTITNTVKVLDHGYIKLIETWGSDEAIVEAARMSTGKGFLGWGDKYHHDNCPNVGEPLNKECEMCDRAPGDEKLLRTLYTHKHASPFEMAGMVIELQAPIFVFREWHRHRTQSYNEASARYIPLPAIDYLPSVERLMQHSTTNKQAGRAAGAAELNEDAAQTWLTNLQNHFEYGEVVYQNGLKIGIPKELARGALTVSRYSRMRAQANLRNWLAFLTLRMDPAAQWEIRVYANEVCKLIEAKFPRVAELFLEGMKK